MTLFRVPLEPSLLRPNLVARTMAEVDWKMVQERFPQVTHVVFDKDNTLTAPYKDHLHKHVEQSLVECIELFGKDRIAILSNSAGTPDDKNFEWKEAVETATGIRVIPHREKKPACLDEVMNHFNFYRIENRSDNLSFRPSSILMVGDRLLTDTVFGNANGMVTLHLTEPLDTHGDNKIAIILRRLENAYLERFL